MLSIRILFVCVAVTALVFVAAACGGDDEVPAGSATPADGPDNGNPRGEEQTFDVVMSDNFFDPDEFTVSPGAAVTFNLTNEGAAVHNMRVAGADGDYRSGDDAVSDPDLSRAGESAVLVWTAPSDPGEIDFRCDFHPDTMVGTITIE